MSKGSLRARRASVLLAVAAVVAVPTAMAGSDVELVGTYEAPASATSDVLVAESPQAYFVEFTRSKADFVAQAKAAGVGYTERYSYGKLFNGISVSIGSTDRVKLLGLAAVKAIYPVYEATLEPTSTTDLADAVTMTGADLANGSGFTGAGVKVAVMDTGVDYNHRDLGGDGVDSDGASNDGVLDNDFPNSRVVAGWDFVGSAFNASRFNADGTPNAGYSPIPVPDPDPDDCNGHGTHVAGIVGAKAAPSSGGVTGVAPDVQFGAYRVFGCAGSTTADIMLAAMERALADGMHVLNMSIGSAFMTWPQYPTARGADALVDAGMVVVASIGNSGADGLYSAGAPGVGNNVIGTASFDNAKLDQAVFTVSPDDTPIGYANATAAPSAPTSGSLELARTGTKTTTNDGCTPHAAGAFAGKAVLIRRGTCTFHLKALHAQNAGAAAVVIYNNVSGAFAGTVAGTPAIAIPVATVNNVMGEFLNDRIAASAVPVVMTWTATTGRFPNPAAGLISSFSSYGMTAELTLKPDIGAPGGLIKSTYPLENGTYATISGTSMSSPHVAGAAALLRQARPTLAASEFRAILQNSADPRPLALAPAFGPEVVHRQGAGMVDVDDAILSTTTVTPGKISLGEGSGGTATLRIANASSSPQTYAVSHLGGVGTGPSTNPANISPFAFGLFGPGATATFSAPSVTVPAGGTGTVGVTIATVAGLPQQHQYGGWIQLTRQSDGQVFRVPYAGFSGDYQSIVHMPIRGSFPALGRRTATPGAFYALEPATGGTYTLTSEQQIPQVLLHFDHQPRRLEIEVVHAATGARLHPVFSNVYEEDYLGRNSTATSFNAFPWNGNRLHSNGNGAFTGTAWKQVPDGQYKLNVKVLKALGDPANPAHWETWTSPTITIDRP